MLDISLDGNIITLVQSKLSFNKTTRTYWYYDIENWLASSHGKEGDVPERKMTNNDIEWVKQYWLPKVMKNPVEASHTL